MSEKLTAKNKFQINETSQSPDLTTDIRAERTEAMRGRISGVGSLKISVPPQHRKKADMLEQEDTVLEQDLVRAPVSKTKVSWTIKALYGLCTFLTMAWITFCIGYALQQGQSFSYAPHELGAFLAGMFAPPALLWMVMGSMHRRADMMNYAAILRGELHSILLPSDETAGMINKDVERLMKQAAEVSTSSRAVLKALQRARQGLRAEIRDFSGVSKKAEFHIDRLADSLTERSEKLGGLIADIEKCTAEIDKTAQNGADAWDTATIRILDRTGEMKEAMTDGVDKILGAAEQAETRTQKMADNLSQSYDRLNESVDKTADRLEGLGSKFDGQSDALSNITDQVAARTEILAENIKDHITSLDELSERVLRAMNQSVDTIDTHKRALGESAEAVAKQSENVASFVAGSAETLQTMVRHVEKETDALEDRIMDKTQRLDATIRNIAREASNVEHVGEEAANKLSEALSAAITGAENVNSAVRRAVDDLQATHEDSEDRVMSIMAMSQDNISKLQSVAQSNVSGMEKVIGLVAQECSSMDVATREMQAKMQSFTAAFEEQDHEIAKSMARLSEGLEDVQAALAKPLRDINSAVTDADMRHQIIEDLLQRRVKDLNDASEKAKESAEVIRVTLNGQAQEISTLSGQIAGQARTINEQMRLQKEELANGVLDSLAQIQRVEESLDAQSKALGGIAQSAIVDINALEGKIADRCGELSSATQKALAEMNVLDNAFEEQSARIKERSFDATQAVSGAKDALLSTAESIVPTCEKAVEAANALQVKYEDLQASYEESSVNNLAKLQKIGLEFDTSLESLKTGSEDAAKILQETSMDLRRSTSSLESASHVASEKMRAVSASLKDQTSDIHLLTDQSLLKIESIQNIINEQFQEGFASVGQAVTQLKDAGEAFVQSSHKIQESAQHSAEGFTQSGLKIRDEATQLNKAVEKTAEQTKLLIRGVKQEAAGLLDQAGETLFELKKAGDTFAIRSGEMAEHMKASLATSQTYGEELKKQSMLIADSSIHSAENMAGAVAILASSMDEIGRSANDVMMRVEGARESLSVESERLLQVSSAALEGARDASDAFARQSESLFKASQDAAGFIEKVRHGELRTQRETFLSSAKFIVESLHSLSVDLSRLMEGDVSEKAWRAFQRGDVSVFTRKLIALGEDWPIEKARDKFVTDTEFRTYVQRYIRQFEEMYDQAVGNDYGALLSTTIGSSEVARLYEFLCRIAGKEAKTSCENMKAA